MMTASEPIPKAAADTPTAAPASVPTIIRISRLLKSISRVRSVVCVDPSAVSTKIGEIRTKSDSTRGSP